MAKFVSVVKVDDQPETVRWFEAGTGSGAVRTIREAIRLIVDANPEAEVASIALGVGSSLEEVAWLGACAWTRSGGYVWRREAA